MYTHLLAHALANYEELLSVSELVAFEFDSSQNVSVVEIQDRVQG